MTETKDALGRAVSRRGFLGTAALAGVSVAGSGALLAGCGGGSSGGPGGGTGGGGGGAEGTGPVTWASWANPGEAERFKQYSKDYEAKNGNKITYQTVVGDYQAKILTQLAGSSAPDAFYVGDSSMAPLIKSGKLEELTSYLESADAAVKLEDTYEGLYQWCKDSSDKLYGIPVDCNPNTFWFNQGMLDAAGVSTNPVAAFEAGTWNRDTLDDLLNKVKGTGKRGMVVEANWFHLMSLVTTFGGTAFDESSGDAVFDEDPSALDTFAWLFDHFKAETITYGGSLPKGQGVEALFYGQQVATAQYGRWLLPNLKKLPNLKFDVAPLPSDTGNEVKPVAVYTAAMSVNTNAKDKVAALKFFANFVNADGQRARLSGGGNAVPSVEGLDEVVTEGNLPANGAVFTEIAANGYAVPLKIARNAVVSTNLQTEIDKIIKSGADAKTFAQKLAAYINGGS